MSNTLKLVIFDLDGTLINAYMAVNRSVNFTMKAVGLPRVDHKVIHRTVGWGDRHLVHAFVGDALIDQAIKVYRAHHKQALIGGTRLFPGAKQVLNYLKKNKIKIAVATNRPTRYTHIILKDLGIRQHFQYILCADKLKKGKPHPEILQKVLKKFSLKPSEAMYVGDMVIDVQTGHAAKVKTVGIATGSSSLKELKKQKPFRIIHKLTQLPKIIEEIQ